MARLCKLLSPQVGADELSAPAAPKPLSLWLSLALPLNKRLKRAPVRINIKSATVLALTQSEIHRLGVTGGKWGNEEARARALR